MTRLPRLLSLSALVAVTAWVAQAADLRGQVLDSRTGEGLARVQIILLDTAHRTQSQAGGEFRLPAVPAGEYVLQVSTVGYWMVKRTLTVGTTDPPALEVVLTPAGDKQVEIIEVKAGPYDLEPSHSAVTMEGPEVQDLATVLTDDPLRAVQNLPGVASNNDHDARFTLRGAEYRRVGVYLDGVLLHSPFHGVPGPGNEADLSMTIFHGDSLESMVLDSGAETTRWGDQTAGALSLISREGNRRRFAVRGKAGIMSSTIALEGPLGANQRGSWLVAARLGYMQLVLNRASGNNLLAYGFQDLSGRLTYDLTRRHQVTASFLAAGNGLDRSKDASNLGLNNEVYSDGSFTLVNLGWRWAPGERLLVTQHAAWIREQGRLDNLDRDILYRNTYGEWVWNGDLAWRGLNAGWSLRRQRNDGASNWVRLQPRAVIEDDAFRGTAWRSGAYAQHVLSLFRGRLRLQTGGRWDRQSVGGIAAWQPQAALTFDATPATRLYAGWSQQVQYPDLTQSFSRLAVLGLLPLKSTHASAAIERRLDERTRLRLEFYNRQDRDLPFRPGYEPYLLRNGRAFPGIPVALTSSLRGYSRGWQVLFQRRTANGFMGWISYAHGRTVLRNDFYRLRFASDYDQRHTLNAYGAYRLRPSLHLSGKLAYGSGFPIPGFLRGGADGTFWLAQRRNEARLPFYARGDVRVNKEFTHRRWKWTLYFEVLNVTNRKNRRLDSIEGWNPNTTQVDVRHSDLLPILPAAGVAVEF